MWIFALFLVFMSVGLLAFARSESPYAKKLLFRFISIILIFSILEIGLCITSFVIKLVKGEWKLSLSAYKDKEWAKAFWKERSQIRYTYEPYVAWKGQEYHGKYINIDSQGVRKTWNPKDLHGKENGIIYVFGGSTVFGFGARDDYTIPSHLSKILNNKNYNFIVYNYGRDAYVFTQELIRLILLLRDGGRPDYVIFMTVSMILIVRIHWEGQGLSSVLQN